MLEYDHKELVMLYLQSITTICFELFWYLKSIIQIIITEVIWTVFNYFGNIQFVNFGQGYLGKDHPTLISKKCNGEIITL